jgi:glucose-1-phosphate cytidylyltransferase
VFKREIFDHLTASQDCDFEFGPLQKLSRKGQMMAYRHYGYWQCMDTARDAEYLNKLWKSGAAPWKTWKR